MKNALRKLKEGNQRFVSGQTKHDIDSICSQRISAVQKQKPFAVILGCSDSRVPAEIVFDQGLGDLFVIRVAGNVVNPSQIGSVEFAVTQFGSPLVIVLGHSNCGVIQASMLGIDDTKLAKSKHIESIIDLVKPALDLINDDSDKTLGINDVVKANVKNSVSQLLASSEIIAARVKQGVLQVSGAYYDLETGEVVFFD